MSKNENARSGRELLNHTKKERCYPTSIKAFNLSVGRFDPITGEPGIPEGTPIEAFGPNASCKSAMWEGLAANIMKMDPKAKVFALLSEDPDPERWESVGIDLDRITIWTYYNPDPDATLQSAEEGLNLLCELVSEDMDYKLTVVDSIKALVVEDQVFGKKAGELKEFSESEAPAIRARLMNRFLGNHKVANKARAILFMVNQVSESIGPNFNIGQMVKTKTAGGREKEHYCKLRIECNSAPPDATDKPVNHKLFGNKIFNKLRCIFFLQKNKFGFPFRKTNVDFELQEKRFANERNCLDFAEYLGIISRSGNANWNLDGKSIKGRLAAEQYLLANPEYEEFLWKQIYPKHKELYNDKPSKSSKEDLEDDD